MHSSDDLVHRSKNHSYPSTAQASNGYEGDYTVPHTRSAPSQNAFFSPQSAFYSSSSQQTIPTNQVASSMELLSNNAFLNVGMKAVGK
ncbi:unnamed protein product, partial [Adineta steineri]